MSSRANIYTCITACDIKIMKKSYYGMSTEKQMNFYSNTN